MKDLLRNLRLECGLTQKELAEKLNSTDKNIWNYEKGLALPPYDILAAYANYFGVTTDYLIGRTDDFGTPTTAPINDGNEQERELLRYFRELSPYLKGMTMEAVKSWAKKSGDDEQKKA